MARLKPPNQTFKVMAQLSDMAAGDGYAHMLLTMGGAHVISQKEWSRIGLDGVQLAQRFGYTDVTGLDNIPELTIYDDDALEKLQYLTKRVPGKPEVDRAILMDSEGRIIISSGTRKLKTDDLEDERLKKRSLGGCGRTALAAITTLGAEDGAEEPIFSYFLSSNSHLFEYLAGRENRIYNPNTGKVNHFLYGPDGTLLSEDSFDVKAYTWKLPGE